MGRAVPAQKPLEVRLAAMVKWHPESLTGEPRKAEDGPTEEHNYGYIEFTRRRAELFLYSEGKSPNPEPGRPPALKL
jgi:hypothetical protein